MKVLVAGNRPLESNVIEMAKDAFVIAADAGADRLLKYNIIPDQVIGDLDSISDNAATKLEECIVPNKDMKKTDLEKAVDFAFEKGATEVTIVGWSGGRIDHTLAALGLALNPKIKLIDDLFTIQAVNDATTIEDEEGTLFSLIAMSEAIVSITGAKWNLKQEKLTIGGSGIHNEIDSSGKTTIECHSGNLILALGNFVLHHD